MDRPIQAGDLVIVLRTHCADGEWTGRIATVDNVLPAATCSCIVCGERHGPHRLARFFIDPADGRWWAAPVEWLKRIPPLEELDDVRRDEEITA